MTETAASDARVASNDATLNGPPPVGILIGYARCSTEKQDLPAQRELLHGLGVAEERVYLDHGLTGTKRSGPGLNRALAALRGVTRWSCPSLTGLRARSRTRGRSETRSPLEASAYRWGVLSMTPATRWASAFSNILATFAEFEVDLRMRTREGMAIARAKGRLKGKAPKLCRTQRTVLLKRTAPGSTRSLSWPNCSPSAAPPSTAESHDRSQQARHDRALNDRPADTPRDRRRHRSRRTQGNADCDAPPLSHGRPRLLTCSTKGHCPQAPALQHTQPRHRR